jgi:chromosome segregation protein
LRRKEKVRISERCASYKREIEERESRVTAGESKPR